jgi:hypothetical protein
MTPLWVAHAILAFWMALGSGLLSFDCQRVWDFPPEHKCPAGVSYERCHGSFALDCPLPDGHRSVIFCLGSNC